MSEPTGIDALLERVRSGYRRIAPRAAYDAAGAGTALLVDIRYAALRGRGGVIPGTLVIERNELEWRLDPQGSHRLPGATGHDLRVVVVCDEGCASSLAAESLHRLGLHRATDLDRRIPGVAGGRTAGDRLVAAHPTRSAPPVGRPPPPGCRPDGATRVQAPSSPRNSVSSPSSSSAWRTTRSAMPSGVALAGQHAREAAAAACRGRGREWRAACGRPARARSPPPARSPAARPPRR